MSGKGDRYDNAVAESFFSTLEFELLRQSGWETREDAPRAIFRYIETWYNPNDLIPHRDISVQRRTKSSGGTKHWIYHLRVH